MTVTPDLDKGTSNQEICDSQKGALPTTVDTERGKNSLVSSNRLLFHLTYILGIFPARFCGGDLLHISLFWTSMPYLCWGILHGVTIYFFYSSTPLAGFFQGMTDQSPVGCDSTVTRGPDFIYNILDILYPVHDLLHTISTLFLAGAMSPTLNKVSSLLNKPGLGNLVSLLFTRPSGAVAV